MNPLDWQGSVFLSFFIALAIVSIIVAVVVRRRRSDSGRGDGLDGLDASSIAYLAGGEARVVDRVVGELLARNAAEFNAKNAVTSIGNRRPHRVATAVPVPPTAVRAAIPVAAAVAVAAVVAVTEVRIGHILFVTKSRAIADLKHFG